MDFYICSISKSIAYAENRRMLKRSAVSPYKIRTKKVTRTDSTYCSKTIRDYGSKNDIDLNYDIVARGYTFK